MDSSTQYACGIVAIPFAQGGADEFARRVAAEAARQDAVFALLFHSLSAFHTDALAAAMREHAPGLPHAGCTTAGELLPSGISDGEALALLLPADRFTVVAAMIERIRSTGMDGIAASVERAYRDTIANHRPRR